MSRESLRADELFLRFGFILSVTQGWFLRAVLPPGSRLTTLLHWDLGK